MLYLASLKRSLCAFVFWNADGIRSFVRRMRAAPKNSGRGDLWRDLGERAFPTTSCWLFFTEEEMEGGLRSWHHRVIAPVHHHSPFSRLWILSEQYSIS